MLGSEELRFHRQYEQHFLSDEAILLPLRIQDSVRALPCQFFTGIPSAVANDHGTGPSG